MATCLVVESHVSLESAVVLGQLLKLGTTHTLEL